MKFTTTYKPVIFPPEMLPSGSISVCQKTSFFDRLQRSKGPQRQATRPRSVYRYSRGSSCAVSQNTLRSKLFVGLLSISILCKLLPYKETRKSSNTCVLTICGFFDTLKNRAGIFLLCFWYALIICSSVL